MLKHFTERGWGNSDRHQVIFHVRQGAAPASPHGLTGHSAPSLTPETAMGSDFLGAFWRDLGPGCFVLLFLPERSYVDL